MKNHMIRGLRFFVMSLIFVSMVTSIVVAEEFISTTDSVIEQQRTSVNNVDPLVDKHIDSNGESPSLNGQPEEIIDQESLNSINTAAEGSYYWPVPDSRQQSQGFTDYHDGLDIVAGSAVPICATMSGTVQIVYSGCANTSGYYNSCSTNCARRNLWTYPYTGTTTCNWGYGNGVVINHGNGYYSHYAHLENVNVSVGQFVSQGQQIGTMGSSGLSTGRHLHFAIATAANGSSGRINNNPGTINYIYNLQPADTTPPTISDVKITDVDASGFTVRCHVDDASGRVQFPTWTSANDQDDIIKDWETNPASSGSIDGNNNVSYRVNYNAHNNERGVYNVHIYAYDAVGNRSACAPTGIEIDGTPPTITDVEVIDQSPYGYILKCKVADNNGISRVQFPTWTSANGQDDINKTWDVDGACSGKIEGDTATFKVNDREHNYERGEYNTHIYAFDTFGNYKCYEVKTNVANTETVISEEIHNNHRYMIYDDAVTWAQAEAKAEELGGTLATISSQDEQSLVEKLIGTGQRDRYFLGGTDEGQEGTFRWVTGEPFGLAKWAPGNPDNWSGNENCLQITREGYWNDVSASYNAGGYIVEVDADKLQIASFKTSDDSGSYTNKNINLSADISGGVAPIQYKFYYKLGDTSTVIQDYSETNTAIFKPVTAGTYTLYVDVKDSEGRTATRSISDYIVQKTIGITYQTQIQNIGWQDPVANGTMSGTSGEGLRLEGIKINLDTQGYDVGVSYQTHIENIGWEADTDRGWKSNGVMSGTEGLGYRLE
uniref:peptidoglycan DD-metalloendopeptidase family protein n=1 Tax=Acetobacterium malicum TaxID=52692 RepID=UPI003592F1E2